MNDTQYRYELLFQHCHEVEAQRDELLAALKKIIVWLEGDDSALGILDTTDGYYEWSIVTMDDRLKARAAIAKAEGEQ